MPYNSQITRTDAASLIPEEAEREIFQAVPESSIVMKMGRRLRDMSRQEKELRVLDGLATAYFVGATTAASGDTGRIQTSELDWANKVIKAAKLGVIVPIPRDVFSDADYDVWSETKPQLSEAFGRAFDAAVLHGTGAPSDWPDDLVTGATSAGNVVDLSSGESAGSDLYDLIMGTSGVIAKVEADGYLVDGHVAAISMRSKLRDLREPNKGAPIFNSDMQSETHYALDGDPLEFPRNGALDPTAALLLSGDWSQLVWSLLKGLEYQILTEATIHDSDDAVVYNLAQDDMVALKATMRLGWQLPNPKNRIEETDADRHPFGILVP